MGDVSHLAGVRVAPVTGVLGLAESVGPASTQVDICAYLDRPPILLIVDAQEVNRKVLRGMLKQEPYRLIEAERADDALAWLGSERVDLVILDLMMPEVSGLELCRRIKANRRTQLVPVMMLTSVQGIESEVAGLASGADEFLNRPLHPTVVRTRIRAMLRNKAAIDSLEQAETILFALAQAVEQRDSYTGGHCQRLSHYAAALGHALGLSRPQLVALHRGGYLHDIGKIGVPDAVLFKRESLDEAEWKLMRAHAINGEAICQPMRSLAPVLPIIRNHHERWDGSGYPDGLKGEDIPLVARVLQIADIYDALTTARPYKPAFTPQEALEILKREAHRGWRDQELVALFEELAVHALEGPGGEESILLPCPDLKPMQESLENMRRRLAE